MKNHILILLLALTLINANYPELPLCPSDISYLPQDLPMHCRMRRDADPPPFPVPPGFPSPIFPPGLPGPPPMPPPPPGMPGAIPMQMMPVPASGPAHKLPVIVMPFYSPDPAFKKDKKRRKHIDHNRKRRPRPRPWHPDTDSSDTDTDTDSDTDSSDSSSTSDGSSGWWTRSRNSRRSNRRQKPRQKRKRHNKKKDLLTPIIQYVTKDGYVIFEKEISKTEAKDWLGVKKNEEKKETQVAYKELDDMNETANRDLEEVTMAKEEEEVEAMTQKAPLKRHRPQQFKAQKIKPHATKTP